MTGQARLLSPKGRLMLTLSAHRAPWNVDLARAQIGAKVRNAVPIGFQLRGAAAQMIDEAWSPSSLRCLPVAQSGAVETLHV